jgi:hypothetical protein
VGTGKCVKVRWSKNEYMAKEVKSEMITKAFSQRLWNLELIKNAVTQAANKKEALMQLV